MRYFTSDLHLGHVNILKPEYCDRPWPDVLAMDEGLIAAYNSVVKPDDEVIIIGDLAMGDKGRIPWLVSRLNGKKHIVLGNHDLDKHGKVRPQIELAGFVSIVTEMKLEEDGKKLYIHHEPNPDWKTEWPEADYHLCGHVHQSFTRARFDDSTKKFEPDPSGLIINVGVDVSGYKPMTFAQLFERPYVTAKRQRI